MGLGKVGYLRDHGTPEAYILPIIVSSKENMGISETNVTFDATATATASQLLLRRSGHASSTQHVENLTIPEP